MLYMTFVNVFVTSKYNGDCVLKFMGDLEFSVFCAVNLESNF